MTDNGGVRADVSEALAYRNVEKLLVLCLVQQDGMVADTSVSASICDRVAQLAAVGTDIPVAVISLGDPQVVAPGRLTILVHAAISHADGEPQMALVMRPYRPSLPEADVLFGATPRIADPRDDAAISRAISAGLDEILPWRSQPGQFRQIQ